MREAGARWWFGGFGEDARWNLGCELEDTDLDKAEIWAVRCLVWLETLVFVLHLGPFVTQFSRLIALEF